MILLVAQSRNIPSLGCPLPSHGELLSPQSEPLDEYWIHIHIVRLYFILILSIRLRNLVSKMVLILDEHHALLYELISYHHECRHECHANLWGVRDAGM